jgi:glycosyltransferase involved in cell wall biosynthesis
VSKKKQDDLGPKRPIRVLRIIARMNVGGPAVQISGLMRGMNFKQFEHLLLTGHCDADESDFLMESATDIVTTRIDGLGRSIKPWSDLSALIEIIRAIRKFKPDVIHTHTSKAGVIGRIASLLSLHSSKRVHTFHGHLLHGYFGRFKTRLVIVVEKVLALFSDHLLAVGKKVQDELLSAGIGNASKFTVMPPGVMLGSVPVSINAKRELGLDSNLLYCSFIGRVTDIKRPDRFLDVVSEISKRDIPLFFFIAGDGNLLEEVRQRIEAESLPVTCLGWQTDIEKLLGASDIVVLTSDNEGTPLSLIQAGMAGVPVVSTNVGSVSEVVINGVTGIITDLKVATIANAIETLVNNPELRSNLGHEAKKFTLANFGVERLIQDHENLYRKITSNPAKF